MTTISNSKILTVPAVSSFTDQISTKMMLAQAAQNSVNNTKLQSAILKGASVVQTTTAKTIAIGSLGQTVQDLKGSLKPGMDKAIQRAINSGKNVTTAMQGVFKEGDLTSLVTSPVKQLEAKVNNFQETAKVLESKISGLMNVPVAAAGAIVAFSGKIEELKQAADPKSLLNTVDNFGNTVKSKLAGALESFNLEKLGLPNPSTLLSSAIAKFKSTLTAGLDKAHKLVQKAQSTIADLPNKFENAASLVGKKLVDKLDQSMKTALNKISAVGGKIMSAVASIKNTVSNLVSSVSSGFAKIKRLASSETIAELKTQLSAWSTGGDPRVPALKVKTK